MAHRFLLRGQTYIPALSVPIQIFHRTTDYNGVAYSFKLMVGSGTGMKHLCNLPLPSVIPQNPERADHAVLIHIYIDGYIFLFHRRHLLKGL